MPSSGVVQTLAPAPVKGRSAEARRGPTRSVRIAG